MASLRKAKIIDKNKCKIRIKETGDHKIVRMIPLKIRIVDRIDDEGDHYTIEEQDYILIDDNQVIGFLISPVQSVMNDVYPDI